MFGIPRAHAYQPHHRTRRSAFTLIEMLVAVGLLLLVMGMASTVFQVTLDGTGRLSQLSEIDRSVRLFSDQLARELRSVDPSRSIMAIQGNPSPAYWSHLQADGDDGNLFNGIGGEAPEDIERQNPTEGYGMDGNFDPDAGDNRLIKLPRADILMFFADLLDARSFVDPEIQSDGPVMVVYNHAELGRLAPVGRSTIDASCTVTLNGCADSRTAWSAFDQTTNPAPFRYIPVLQNGPAMDPRGNTQRVAQDWHLARRAILIKETYDPQEENVISERDRFGHFLSPTDPSGNWNAGFLPNATPAIPLNEVHFLNWILGGEMDVVAPFALPLPGLSPPSSVIFGAGNAAFDYRYEVSERFFGGGATDTCMPDSWRFDSDPAAGLPGCADDANSDGVVDDIPAVRNRAGWYRGGLPAFWVARSHLDPSPPANMAHRLGHFFLPNCASFKVEWTPNDVRLTQAGLPEVLWIDPYKEPMGNPITATTTKPGHLHEFEILAQKMAPSPGDVLSDNPTLGYAGTLGGSKLLQVRDALLPRFGLSQGPDPAQLNVFDTDANAPGVQPSDNTHVWFAGDLVIDAGGNPRTSPSADRLWPRALRITVDLFDDARTFDTPIRHVFVVPVGPQGDVKQTL